MPAVSSTLLSSISGLQHGYGNSEEPIPSQFTSLFTQTGPRWKQVHGIHGAEVLYPRQEIGDVDAMYTSARNLPIGVVTADCVPILLSRRDSARVAAIHAGWRGTYDGITSHLWNTLSAQGEVAHDWVAAIGPAIGPCCYEVSEELEKNFLTRFSWLKRQIVVPERRHLDLQEIQRQELIRLGFQDVDVLRHCTRCLSTFHSYRRDQTTKRQYSLIAIS